jgi:hypothetical protein
LVERRRVRARGPGAAVESIDGPRDLDEGIITSHIRRLRDQLADEIQRFIHQRSATSDGAMIADIALSALEDGLTPLRHFGLD